MINIIQALLGNNYLIPCISRYKETGFFINNFISTLGKIAAYTGKIVTKVPNVF